MSDGAIPAAVAEEFVSELVSRLETITANETTMTRAAAPATSCGIEKLKLSVLNLTSHLN